MLLDEVLNFGDFSVIEYAAFNDFGVAVIFDEKFGRTIFRKRLMV
jgi:hypothetical protein